MRFLNTGSVIYNQKANTFQFVTEPMGPELMVKYGLNHCPKVTCGQVSVEEFQKVHWTDIDHHVFLENVGKPLNGPSLLAQEDMLESSESLPPDHPLHYTLLPIRKMQGFSLNPQEPQKVPVPKRIGARGSMRDALNRMNSTSSIPEPQSEINGANPSNSKKRNKKKEQKEIKELCALTSGSSSSSLKKVFEFEEIEGKLKKMLVEKSYTANELANKRIISLLCEIVQKTMRKNVSFHHEVVPNEDKFRIVLNVETEKVARAITNISGGVNPCKVLLSAHSMVRISPEIYNEWYFANTNSSDMKNAAELKLIQDFFHENQEDLLNKNPPYQLVPKGSPPLLKDGSHKHTQQTQSDNETDTTTTHHSNTFPISRDQKPSPFKENGFNEIHSSPMMEEEGEIRPVDLKKKKEVKKEKNKANENPTVMQIENEESKGKSKEKKLKGEAVKNGKKSKGSASKMIIERIGNSDSSVELIRQKETPPRDSDSLDNSTEYIDFDNPIFQMGKATQDKPSQKGKEKTKKVPSPMIIEDLEDDKKSQEDSNKVNQSPKKLKLANQSRKPSPGGFSQCTEPLNYDELNMSINIGKLSLPRLMGDNFADGDMDGMIFNDFHDFDFPPLGLGDGLNHLDNEVSQDQINLKPGKENGQKDSPYTKTKQSLPSIGKSGKETSNSIGKEIAISVGRSGVLEAPAETEELIELENAEVQRIPKEIMEMGRKLSASHPKQDLIAIFKKLLEEPYFNLSLMEIYDKSKACSEGTTLKDFAHRIANYLTVNETQGSGPEIKILLFSYAKANAGYILYRLIFNGETIMKGERNILDKPGTESFEVLCSMLMNVFRSEIKIQEILEAMILDLYEKVLIAKNSEGFLKKKAQETVEAEMRKNTEKNTRNRERANRESPKASTCSTRSVNGALKWNGGISPRKQAGEQSMSKRIENQPVLFGEEKMDHRNMERDKEVNDKIDGILSRVKNLSRNRLKPTQSQTEQSKEPDNRDYEEEMGQGNKYREGNVNRRNRAFDDNRNEFRNKHNGRSYSQERTVDRRPPEWNGNRPFRKNNEMGPDRLNRENSRGYERNAEKSRDGNRGRYPQKDDKQFRKNNEYGQFERNQGGFFNNKGGRGHEDNQFRDRDDKAFKGRDDRQFRERDDQFGRSRDSRPNYDREEKRFNNGGPLSRNERGDGAPEDGEIAAPMSSSGRERRGSSGMNQLFSRGPNKNNKFRDQRDRDRRSNDRGDNRGMGSNKYFQTKHMQKGEQKRDNQMSFLRDEMANRNFNSHFGRGNQSHNQAGRHFNGNCGPYDDPKYGKYGPGNYENGRDHQEYDNERRKGYYSNSRDSEFDGFRRPKGFEEKRRNFEGENDPERYYGSQQRERDFQEEHNYEIQMPQESIAPHSSQTDFNFGKTQSPSPERISAHFSDKEPQDAEAKKKKEKETKGKAAKGKEKPQKAEKPKKAKQKDQEEKPKKGKKAKELLASIPIEKPVTSGKGSRSFLGKRDSGFDRFHIVDEPTFMAVKAPKQVKLTSKKSTASEALNNSVILLE